MATKTGIAWTNHTWNPWRGCRKISTGCRNCYMFRDQLRYGRDPRQIIRAADPTFRAPLKWDSGLVFTCSWSDFFVQDADKWRPAAWDIMRKTPHLTYQILTKRILNVPDRLPDDWPLPNVWLGVTAENQQAADMRIPELAKIPATKRFVCAEPLLGPIDFGCTCWLSLNTGPNNECENCGKPRRFHYAFEWLILGGESGRGARLVSGAWIRDIRDQCADVGIPFFFKQWGGTKKINGVWGGNELEGKRYMAMPTVKGDE